MADDTGKTVSAEVPDWNRERPLRFWDPGRKLLLAIRRYQYWRAKGGLIARGICKWLVLRHRFWSVVAGAYYRPIWRCYVSDLCKWLVKRAVGHPDRVRIPSYRDWESRTHKAIFDCTSARTQLGWAPASDRQRMIEEGKGGSLEAWLAACE